MIILGRAEFPFPEVMVRILGLLHLMLVNALRFVETSEVIVKTYAQPFSFPF